MTAEELAFQMGEAMSLPTTSLRRPEDMTKFLLPYAAAFLAMREALATNKCTKNGCKTRHCTAVREALAQAAALLEKL